MVGCGGGVAFFSVSSLTFRPVLISPLFLVVNHHERPPVVRDADAYAPHGEDGKIPIAELLGKFRFMVRVTGIEDRATAPPILNARVLGDGRTPLLRMRRCS